MFLAFPKYCFN